MLRGVGPLALLGALDGCALTPAASDKKAAGGLQLAPVRASTDRITRISVCTRPFRAQGPRIEVEKIGSKTVVHNYGHGGSGWLVALGGGRIATDHALATGERDDAVIVSGAIGFTTALPLQRAAGRSTR